MTHDELERAIEFLLTQQAKLTTDVGQLTASVNGMNNPCSQYRNEEK